MIVPAPRAAETMVRPSNWVAEVRTWRDDRAVGELTEARGKKLILRLDGTSEFQFSLSGYSREAALLHELVYDLVLYREGEPVFRGRLGTSQDQVETDRHDLPFSAIDYRGMLDRRHLLGDDRPVGTPYRFDQWGQSDIAWWMVNYTQTRTDGDMGIIRGANPSGQPARDRSYDAGAKIGELIGNLGRVINGFDWEVDALRRFNIYYPERGTDTGAPLEYGTHIRRLQRTWAASEYANAVIGTGAEGTAPIVLESPELGTLPQGRVEGEFSDQDISVWSTLYQYTQAALDAGADPIGGYVIELEPGAYDASKMVLGNSYEVRVRSGRLDFKRTLRIQEIEITLTDDGDEQVVLTMGKPPGSAEQRSRRTDTRLAALERTAATRTLQQATVITPAAGGPRAVQVTGQVDIGELPDGQYGLRVDGALVAPRGVRYADGGGQWGIRFWYNWYPPNPQPGDVVFVPR